MQSRLQRHKRVISLSASPKNHSERVCVCVSRVLLSCVVLSAVTPPSRLKKKQAPVTSRGDGWWWGLTESVKKRNGDARRV